MATGETEFQSDLRSGSFNHPGDEDVHHKEQVFVGPEQRFIHDDGSPCSNCNKPLDGSKETKSLVNDVRELQKTVDEQKLLLNDMINLLKSLKQDVQTSQMVVKP